MIEKNRKAETRKKIQLGGLIMKAQLGEESATLLYGLLLEAKEKLRADTEVETKLRWQLKGELAFKE